jgi:hypothetical protein
MSEISSLNDLDVFEYGVVLDVVPDLPHRAGMTAAEAEKWIAEWVEMGGRPEAVSIIRRRLGNWERP